MPIEQDAKPNILVTGAGGMVGGKVLTALSRQREMVGAVIALDIRQTDKANQLDGIKYLVGDICDPAIEQTFREHAITVIVHLAAILTPGKDSSAAMEHRVDVLGTGNILEVAAKTGVRQIISLSSGAAYGYHADNRVPLSEGDPLRGNDAFTYSKHKRLVEEKLERYRESHPQLRQLVLRPGTILGENVRSPVSAVFEGPVVVGVAGASTPFVMIHVDDVAAIILKGILECREGIYNLAGDGVLTLREIAKLTGKPHLQLYPGLLKFILALLKALNLSARGPEGVDFLRYRPVLANARLKHEFGFEPTKTTAQVFDCYLRSLEPGGSGR
jgi:UDP-glucose 4-epimerase